MMGRINDRIVLGLGIAAGLSLALPLAEGRQKTSPPAAATPAQPVNIKVSTVAPAPDVSLSLGARTGKVTPLCSGVTHTGGGNIDVQQPSPDQVVITMSGVAVAYGGPTCSASASQVFDLVQQFDVSFDTPGIKSARLTVEGRLIGLLRSHKIGSAEVCAGATVTGGPGSGLTLVMPSHSVAGNESLSVNDKETPLSASVKEGKFTLNQSFKVAAMMPKSILPCKAPSAEFAPDPALDPLWITPNDPFKGAKKADLGFQVTIKVSPQAVPAK